MPERYEIPPERLQRWLDRWVAEHGEVVSEERGDKEIELVAADNSWIVCEPPFPPVAPKDSLVDHALRDRTVGVLLVRLGASAAGIFEGTRLVASKVERRLVHGRNRAGGQSQRRFERRREGQARQSLQAAADVAVRILLPEAGRLDAVVLGGDRGAVTEVLHDRRLEPLRPLVQERILDVPEPRLAILESTPERFRATVIRPS